MSYATTMILNRRIVFAKMLVEECKMVAVDFGQ